MLPRTSRVLLEVMPDTHGGVCRLLYSLLYSLRGCNPFSRNDLSWGASPQTTGRFSPNHRDTSPQTTGTLLPKPQGHFSPNHGGTSPQTTGALLPKPRGHFSPNHGDTSPPTTGTLL